MFHLLVKHLVNHWIKLLKCLWRKVYLLHMPLNIKGKKILKAMEKEYGKKKGKEVFYASENKGTIKGVKKSKKAKK